MLDLAASVSLYEHHHYNTQHYILKSDCHHSPFGCFFLHHLKGMPHENIWKQT